ncbi:HipA domain-containing protein [Niveibacterium sp. SC-1]|uniref:HipA domain-containing protein n=1 Tax=Niveibacterium sp. SC-1 TaxID=3135646 RepID=UPI00312000B1
MISDESARAAALARMFDMVAISCMLGNGDAHLKNFGLLYEGAGTNVALAPAFDIVNTTCYIPEDGLALSLGGSKSLFASRLHLLDFADKCAMTTGSARRRIRHMIEVAHSVVADLDALVDEVPGLGLSLERELGSFRETFASGAH